MSILTKLKAVPPLHILLGVFKHVNKLSFTLTRKMFMSSTFVTHWWVAWMRCATVRRFFIKVIRHDMCCNIPLLHRHIKDSVFFATEKAGWTHRHPLISRYYASGGNVKLEYSQKRLDGIE